MHRIYRVGVRQALVLGGDRELVLTTGLLAAILIFAALDFLAAVIGVALWILSLWGFRRMAKHDPLLRHVYLVNLWFKPYYPPRSTPFFQVK